MGNTLGVSLYPQVPTTFLESTLVPNSGIEGDHSY